MLKLTQTLFLTVIRRSAVCLPMPSLLAKQSSAHQHAASGARLLRIEALHLLTNDDTIALGRMSWEAAEGKCLAKIIVGNSRVLDYLLEPCASQMLFCLTERLQPQCIPRKRGWFSSCCAGRVGVIAAIRSRTS